MVKLKADCCAEEWQDYLARRREANRRWRKSNPEKVKGYKQNYRKSHPDQERQANHRYRSNRAERRLVENAAWRSNNRELLREYDRWYRLVRKCRTDKAAAHRLFLQIQSMIPASADRMDIIGEAMVILFEGRARTVEASVALGRKSHYRKFSKFGQPVSLDVQLPGGQSRYDVLAAEVAA